MMWFSVLLLATGTASTVDCSVDRDALLALDEKAFDQDLDGGWRRMAKQPDCALAAADLIEAYREAHPEHSILLYWHEGQLRATGGQTEAAIALFGQSYEQPNFWNIETGWNSYVDATIAFLRADMVGLKAAREKLAALPVPAEQPDVKPEVKKEVEFVGNWPLNLDVIDGLIDCFGKPYRIAYGPSCRAKSQ